VVMLVRADSEECLNEDEAGRALYVAVAVVLAGLHYPTTATAWDRDRLPAGLLAGDTVSAAARSELSLHRRRLTLYADCGALHQLVGRRRLRRGPGHVAPRTNTGQLEHHTVPADASTIHHVITSYDCPVQFNLVQQSHGGIQQKSMKYDVSKSQNRTKNMLTVRRQSCLFHFCLF